jgi:hypothetical protein
VRVLRLLPKTAPSPGHLCNYLPFQLSRSNSFKLTSIAQPVPKPRPQRGSPPTRYVAPYTPYYHASSLPSCPCTVQEGHQCIFFSASTRSRSTKKCPRMSIHKVWDCRSQHDCQSSAREITDAVVGLTNVFICTTTAAFSDNLKVFVAKANLCQVEEAGAMSVPFMFAGWRGFSQPMIASGDGAQFGPYLKKYCPPPWGVASTACPCRTALASANSHMSRKSSTRALKVSSTPNADIPTIPPGPGSRKVPCCNFHEPSAAIPRRLSLPRFPPCSASY